MKHFLKPVALTGMCAGSGLVCLCLRQWLLSTSIDGKGMLTAHPAALLCWLPVAAVAVALILLGISRCQYILVRSPMHCVGTVFRGLGYAAVAIQITGQMQGASDTAVCVLAAAAALCCIVEAWLLFQNKKVSSLLHLPGILFFIVYLLLCYQQWSGETELQRYCFQLLASVGLMFTVYHKALLAEKVGSSTRYLVFSRAALFFCISAIPGSSNGILYGAMAVSVMFDGCAILAKPVREE